MKGSAWHIGEYGEIYAAENEEAVKRLLAGMIGEREAAQSIADFFEELTESDLNKHVWNEDGTETEETLRQLIDSLTGPMQISSCYG